MLIYCSVKRVKTNEKSFLYIDSNRTKNLFKLSITAFIFIFTTANVCMAQESINTDVQIKPDISKIKKPAKN